MPTTSRSRTKAFARGFLYYFVTGLILAIPALMNQSPLVFSDSGAYIVSSFKLTAMTDRPMGYPLILRAVTWQASMWPMIFFQCTLASWLIQLVLRQLQPQRTQLWRLHIPLLGILLLTSSLAWYTSQLMPDALSGFLGLLLFLVFFGKNLGTARLIFLWICLFFVGLSHFGHMAVLIAIAGCLLLVRRLPGYKAVFGRRFWWNWTGLVAVLLGTMVFTRGYNQQQGHGWVMAPASDLFLAAKLCESGVMYEHLKRTCPDHDHPLCAHLDAFNTSAMFYIWDDTSPLKHPDGQIAASKSIAPLLHEVLCDPANWGLIAWTTFTGTLIQLTQVDIGAGLRDYREETAPWWPYQYELHHELPLYMNSHQQNAMWHFDTLNHINFVVLPASLIIMLLLWRNTSIRLRAFMVVAFAVVFFNAMATAGLANIYDRLHARVTWLVVLAACLVLLEQYVGRRRTANG
ncbi:MAG: hypothetical protein ABI599_03895 [Flavobacteriales bacterium]